MQVKHPFHSPKDDGPDSTRVRPSNWNADHDVIVSVPSVYIGRDRSGAGSAQQLPVVNNGAGDDGAIWTADKVEAAIAAALATALAPQVSPPVYVTYLTWGSIGGGFFPLNTVPPVISDGNGLMATSYVALNAAHRIRVRCSGSVSTSPGANPCVALFIDNGTVAVRSRRVTTGGPNWIALLQMEWEGVLAAGAHQFDLRLGCEPPNQVVTNGGFIANYDGAANAWVMTVEELLAP